jgi:hypothetical protein
MTEMWEILVPQFSRMGFKWGIEVHRGWDCRVKEITGGLTIMPPTKGYWGDAPPEGMIPVRIACTRAQMDVIGPMTKEYYDQEQILAYKVSDEVVFYS